MKLLQTVILVASTISTGLMAGLFAAFSYSVMPGLGLSSDRTMVEAMRNINKAIVNPTFMSLFMGSIPLIAVAGVLAWRGYGRPALPWIIAALVLYLVAFFITSGVNVPLNDQLAKATGAQHLAAAREQFESSWVFWNAVRALLHTAAFGFMAWALIVFGAHRLSAVSQPASPATVPYDLRQATGG
ncbi:DUF1772 domain-containing protein [Nonomuraea sp. NBC_01738]|uniref:anthrone oxygenase family protein n=1 Tax=Nonomuraea sp. NBC_01738 TaxID=2976003 RepID=UPI002E145B5C|nr:DUF1772 domain-containing protein [Nonomuraea sp. NBC_01738]